ncbi:hypothetical protein [Nocardioides sp.]|uniref:hypothetical protein n=1 Tax=Nocardioides sp. TaxID=35761 RepID=UPI00286C90F0|nr:hypothetical protein [Nocardioides sp.]
MADRRSSARVRVIVARVVWALFVVCASALAVAALLIALDAEPTNPFVEFVLDLADGVDLGIFSLENPIKKFGGENGETTTALFNYGLGAVAYLVVGRLLERVIRP